MNADPETTPDLPADVRTSHVRSSRLSLDLLDNDDPTKRALPENAAQVFERAAAETGMTVHQQEKRVPGLGSGLGSIVDGITNLVPGLGDVVNEVLPLRASIEVDLEVCLCANAAVNIGESARQPASQPVFLLTMMHLRLIRRQSRPG